MPPEDTDDAEVYEVEADAVPEWSREQAAVQIAWSIVDNDPRAEKYPLAVHAAAVGLIVALLGERP